MTTLATDLNRMLALLVSQHEALRKGDLDKVERIAGRIGPVLARLESAEAPDPALHDLALAIAERAQRGESLLEASLAGVRDAQALVARARQPHRHETYARDGRREFIGEVTSNLERRA